MTRDQITDEVKKIFTEQFGEDAAKRLDTEPEPFKPAGEANRFADDLDSLDHVEFIMALEDHFKIEIDDVTAALVKTLDDAVNVVETRTTQPVHADR